MIKVTIASDRWSDIGERCFSWARDKQVAENPNAWMLWTDKTTCDVFISVLYDSILSPEFLSKPGRRAYNFHPGLLPEYRGSGAYSWALINKEPVTGVTLHEIDANIDSGRVLAYSQVEIEKPDTAETLYRKSMDSLFELFKTFFQTIVDGHYYTFDNDGGKLYLRKYLEQAKDITHLVKAFTFEGKESAYWVDSKGEKRYVEYE